MNKQLRNHLLTLAFAMGSYSCGAFAEDIDLFASAAPVAGGGRPNVLIVIDNSANWSRNDQHWPGNDKQGQSELRALLRLLPEVPDTVNIGLVMFTAGSGGNKNGAYVRFHSRPMNGTYKTTTATAFGPAGTERTYRQALEELIGTDTCVNGPNSLNGTPNCILKNYDSSTEKISTSSVDYSAGMFEVFKYFGGYTNPANAHTDIAGSPISASQYGALRYAGNPDAKSDPAAYVNGLTDTTKRAYISPIDNQCATNAIILIGNGFPNNDSPASLLSGVGGNTTQLPMPRMNGNGLITPTGNDIRYTDEWAKFLYTTDVHSSAGQQNVKVYTVDAYNAKPDIQQNRLLKSMADQGGGRYFVGKDENAILDAFRDILLDVKAVSSVFTSSSVPINATNRTQHENQVYIGMFRPDADSRPRWYGNLKRFQVGIINGELTLTDRDGLKEAIAASTGFLQSCAKSYWTTDSGAYWDFSPESAGQCDTATTFSDLPDGGTAEKGGAAQVLRRGNDPTNPGYVVRRTVYTTCTDAASCPTALNPSTSLVPFDATSVSAGRLGVSTAAEQQRIIDHTLGVDVNNENRNADTTESRPSLHGDVIHSHPLPVTYGSSTGVVLFYGSNDGSFRALSGDTGKELWAFVAPEHHSRLKRLTDNSPIVQYPGMTVGVVPTPQRKDYFFDGSPALYQNADNSAVWVFPTMRRGGRMVYALDVTTPTSPTIKWRLGCPHATNDTECSTGFEAIGQTWSTPRVAKVKGYDSGNTPILIMGGGYDTCEDTDSPTPPCSGSIKGNKVYVINANTGVLLASFPTTRSVAAEVTLVDRDGDGYVDHAYVADTGGTLYRLDLSNATSLVPMSSANWALNPIAQTTVAGHKFLQAPAVLALANTAYVAIGSGDREQPLNSQYPYLQDVVHRFYMFKDRFASAAAVQNLDDDSTMANYTASTTCSTKLATSHNGWYMDLNSGLPSRQGGEQTVTSALIFGGIVYFSTNRATPTTSAAICTPNLGEARGYAVNLLNASGAVGTQDICGGTRSGLFQGGGIPPSPVTANLLVNGKPQSILFGGVQRSGGASSSIGAQKIKPNISGKRTRTYWYTQGNK
jgi:type IV pilus assembly protein PilY1